MIKEKQLANENTNIASREPHRAQNNDDEDDSEDEKQDDEETKGDSAADPQSQPNDSESVGDGDQIDEIL